MFIVKFTQSVMTFVMSLGKIYQLMQRLSDDVFSTEIAQILTKDEFERRRKKLMNILPLYIAQDNCFQVVSQLHSPRAYYKEKDQ